MKTNPLLKMLCLGAALLAAQLSFNANAGFAVQDVEIEVLGDHSGELRQIPLDRGRHSKTNRAYLEARQGEGYAIRLRNRTGERVGLVIAVDGRNIISGKRSDLARNERMYVLEPHASATYEGWRTAKNRVNRFYFTDAGDSYADAFDDHSAMGVIAVAVYREKQQPPELIARPRMQPRHKTLQDEQTGTGFGESEWSPSRMVSFEPRRRASSRHFLKYEWSETLCRKGVLECHQPYNRFWLEDQLTSDDGRFAPYPPGYRGNRYGNAGY